MASGVRAVGGATILAAVVITGRCWASGWVGAGMTARSPPRNRLQSQRACRHRRVPLSVPPSRAAQRLCAFLHLVRRARLRGFFSSIPSAAPLEKLLEQLVFRRGSSIGKTAPFQVSAKAVAQIGIDRALRGRLVEPGLRGLESGPARHLRGQIHVLPLRVKSRLLQLGEASEEGLGKAGNLFVALAALRPVEYGQDIADGDGLELLTGRNEVGIVSIGKF